MLASPSESHVQSYQRGAREFIDILDRSLAKAGRDWSSIGRVLEIGCGYGRIVRKLRSRIDPSKIYVCDVIQEGAEFAASEFGVHALPPIEKGDPDYQKGFDLIYLLSVYTHLDRKAVATSLRLAADALKPGGIIVFTVHGQASADSTDRYNQYWLEEWKVQTAMAGVGYYYERYPYYYDEVGLTWFTPSAVQQLVAEVARSLDIISYLPAEIDGHQDVFVYRKS